MARLAAGAALAVLTMMVLCALGLPMRSTSGPVAPAPAPRTTQGDDAAAPTPAPAGCTGMQAAAVLDTPCR
jgi:hypothetical protein